jgi:hypothetical protein
MSQCLTQEQCNPCRGQLEDGPAPEQPPIDLSNFILAMGLNFLGDNPEHSMMEVRWKTDGSASDTAMEEVVNTSYASKHAIPILEACAGRDCVFPTPWNNTRSVRSKKSVKHVSVQLSMIILRLRHDNNKRQ